MRHHQAKCGARIVEHGGAHGGVAMQIDIVLHRTGKLGPRWFARAGFLASVTFCAGAARFLVRQPAFVTFDLAAM
jgi:hypothetical protein